MTDREAFVTGVHMFCKHAGFDDEDTAQVERVLFMTPEEGAPIIKNAQATMRLVKSALSPDDFKSMVETADPGQLDSLRSMIEDRQKQDSQWWGGAGALRRAGNAIGGAISKIKDGIAAAGKENGQPSQQQHEQWTQEYENSPYKGKMTPQKYVELRHRYQLAEQSGTAYTPLNDFLTEQEGLQRNREMKRITTQNMRQYGIDMPPGELARMSEADIAARSEGDEAFAISLRRAVQQAKARERRTGGVSGRMNSGFVTKTPAEQAAAKTPSPIPSSTPTSTGPTTSNSPPTDQEMNQASPASTNTATPPTSVAPTNEPAADEKLARGREAWEPGKGDIMPKGGWPT